MSTLAKVSRRSVFPLLPSTLLASTDQGNRKDFRVIHTTWAEEQLTFWKKSFWRRAASFLLGLSRPAARELRSKRRVPTCLRSSSRASVLHHLRGRPSDNLSTLAALTVNKAPGTLLERSQTPTAKSSLTWNWQAGRPRKDQQRGMEDRGRPREAHQYFFFTNSGSFTSTRSSLSFTRFLAADRSERACSSMRSWHHETDMHNPEPPTHCAHPLPFPLSQQA